MVDSTQPGTAPVPPASPEALRALIERRARQFLVHSFLYDRLGESVLSDAAFDRIAAELHRLHAAHPEVPLPFADVLAPALGPEGSGFSIADYPPQIVSAAFKLLYVSEAPAVDFTEYVERRGYTVAFEPAEPAERPEP